MPTLVLGLLLAATAGSGLAGVASVGSPPGLLAPAGEKVHPAVRPATGGPQTRFTLRLTARLKLGQTTGLRSVYVVSVSGPVDCPGGDRSSTTLARGRAGQRLAVALRGASSSGWCPGGHRVTVTLARRIICAPDRACPAIAFAPVQVGAARFTVR